MYEEVPITFKNMKNHTETASLCGDRRKAVRSKKQNAAFLLHSNGIHEILDMSKNGLSFRCLEDDFFPSQWMVDIIVAGTQIYVEKVAVRFVQEIDECLPSFISKPSKKVGVEFLAVDEKTILPLVESICIFQHE